METAATMMATAPKASIDKDDEDDVVLYMDDLKGNNSPANDLSYEVDGRVSPSIVAESNSNTLEKLRNLDTDYVNTDLVEVFDPSEHNNHQHRHRDHYPGVDDGLYTDSDDEKPTVITFVSFQFFYFSSLSICVFVKSD